jgi:hypothetical protein
MAYSKEQREAKKKSEAVKNAGESGSVVVVNRGPQDYRESNQSFPVGQEVTVSAEVAERLVNDFQGSKFHGFEVVGEGTTVADEENQHQEA